MLLFGLAGVAWPLSSLPSFSLTVLAQDVVAGIIGDDRFKSETLDDILAHMHAAKQLIQRPKFLRAEALIALRISEGTLSRMGPDDSDRAVEGGKSKLMSALSMAPTDAFLWLMLYSVELERNGFEAGTIRFLDQSYVVGPLEGWIALRRNKLALGTFLSLDEAMRTRVVAEFAHMVDSNFIEVAAGNLIGIGWPQKERLLMSLANVDLIPREAFAKILSREGLKVGVPGVERDERPWH